MLTFLMIFSLLTQGVATYADPILAKVADHPIISQTIEHHANIATAEACCAEDMQETTTPSCNGNDCKFYFSNVQISTSPFQSVHTVMASTEKFSFYNLVGLRPPKA